MTLGHQRLFLHGREVTALRKDFKNEFGSWPATLDDYQWGDYADGFFRDFLGVARLTVVDASAYEGADVIHDMNIGVPSEFFNQFDAVIDCGSLEHIFNVPVALTNLAKMLNVGGTIFITTPANNLMGHGFYQFSPELMFRVFAEENGFSLHGLRLCEARFPAVELTRNRRIFAVKDPQRVHKRVGLISWRPARMMVVATKTEDSDVFARPDLGHLA